MADAPDGSINERTTDLCYNKIDFDATIHAPYVAITSKNLQQDTLARLHFSLAVPKTGAKNVIRSPITLTKHVVAASVADGGAAMVGSCQRCIYGGCGFGACWQECVGEHRRAYDLSVTTGSGCIRPRSPSTIITRKARACLPIYIYIIYIHVCMYIIMILEQIVDNTRTDKNTVHCIHRFLSTPWICIACGGWNRF